MNAEPLGETATGEESPTSETALLRVGGALLIAIALAMVAGRIAVVRSAEGDTAFLSANDRSRWANVAALVEDGTYQIDRLVAITDASGRRRPWNSIDRVQHTGPDGVMHDYSSKPPLLATLVAGVYAVACQVSGMTLTEQPIYMTRIVLALVNLPVLWLMLAALWKIIRASGISAIAQLAALAVACFGTMLMPMAVSLNNHLPAAAATAVVLMIYLSRQQQEGGRWQVPAAFVAGIAAAFTVACELPALLMLVLWAGLFFRQHPRSSWVGFAPGAAVVAIAFFGTNWLAHQTLIPPYAHRSDGPVIAHLEAVPQAPAAAEQAAAGQAAAGQAASPVPSLAAVAAQLRAAGELHPRNADSPLERIATAQSDRWVVQTIGGDQRFVLRRSAAEEAAGASADTATRWALHRWGNWYDYPGSYWTTQRRGVDRGEPHRGVYAFQLTLGYYGIFSLTPVWLLMPWGLARWVRQRQGADQRWLAAAIVTATLVCLAFYINRPLIDRNYGGVSSSFRWMLWFAPLWIWGLLPAAQRCSSSRWGRWLLVVLIAASVFSVATSLESPWRHPWIYRYVEFLGWLGA